MDSTIVTGETLDELAKHAGLKDEISEITAKAMRGVELRVCLARARVYAERALGRRPAKNLARDSNSRAGARELVQTMSAHGAHCVLISGGFSAFYRSRGKESRIS